MIIGLCGLAGSGKDEVGKILEARGYKLVKFAEPLWGILEAINPLIPMHGISVPNDTIPREVEVCRLNNLINLYGRERTKTLFPEVRRLLQKVGTEGGRNVIGVDVWVDVAMQGVKHQHRLVLTDVRFDNEAEAIYKLRGIVLEVVRPGVERINGHSSEHGISTHLVAGNIINSGDKKYLEGELDQALSLAEPNIRWCPDCAEFKNTGDFQSEKSSYCKKCVSKRGKKWVKNNKKRVKENSRKNHLNSTYGITPEEYDQMLQDQGGVCPLCFRTPEEAHNNGRYFCVDHDHATGRVRGLLCSVCNSSLHAVEMFPYWASRAEVYLREPVEQEEENDYRCSQCGDCDPWFDRSVCPEPCNAMHYICETTGLIDGHCALDGPTGDRADEGAD